MKAAILGTVGNSRRVAPYEDPSWEIWVCSPGNSQASAPPRITRWFEIHAIVDCLGHENAAWWPAYVAWLNANAANFPIYMQERNSIVPAALPFPRNELLKRWGKGSPKCKTNWFTSSIAWMMAFALLEGATEIGIFGVDMAAAEEHYTMQKGGILRFVEIAEEMGVPVRIPLESTLAFGAPLYGYAEASRLGRSLIVRETEMKEKLGILEAQQRNITLECAYFKGAIEQIQFDRRTIVDGEADAEVDFESASAAAINVTLPEAQRPSSEAPSAADFDDPAAKALLEMAAALPVTAETKSNGSLLGSTLTTPAIAAAMAKDRRKQRRKGGRARA